MRRLFLLLGVCFVMALMIAPAAGAQSSGGQAADMAAGSPPPPVYVVEADGTVIYEGDVVTDCSSFLIGYQQGFQGGMQREARKVADKCRQLRVPSGDGTIGNSEIVLSLGTTGSPKSSTGAEVLPDTGGLSLSLLGTLAGGLALIGFGGLALKRASNYR